jgi:methyl-accepting chemotaxis protein
MNLDNEVLRHVDWKVRFTLAMSKQESLDAYIIGKDNRCELGKWLHGDGKMHYSNLKSYEACLKKHAEFHTEAEKIAVAINAKKYHKASKMINEDSTFSAVVNEVYFTVLGLKRDCCF